MVQVIYSTLTGNTQKVAEAIYDSIDGDKHISNIKALELDKLSPRDVLVICYWCSRGTADADTTQLIKELSGFKIITAGTLGTYDDGREAAMMKERVREAVTAGNTYLGGFVCRGKIDPARTEKRRLIPKGQPHYLDDEGYKRHLSSRIHPTDKDLKNAQGFVNGILGQLSE